MSQKAIEIAEAEMEVQERCLEAQDRWMDWLEAQRKVDDAAHRLNAVRDESSSRLRRED